jgi:pantetheine-phosphate adenylyltransferase
MKIGLFAGNGFDPITNNDLDLIGRIIRYGLVDHLVIAIDTNPQCHSALFSVEQREELIKESIKSGLSLPPKQYTITSFTGHLSFFAQEIKANFLIRGINNTAELEHEIQLATINKNAYSVMETVILFSKPELSIVSSSMVRELAALDGDVSPYVQRCVLKALQGITK